MSDTNYTKRLDRLEAIMVEMLNQIVAQAEDADRRQQWQKRVEEMLADLWTIEFDGEDDDDDISEPNGNTPPEGETT